MISPVSSRALLILGAGGREHALAWRLSRESAVTALYCAPGNVGIAAVAELVAVDPGDPDALLAFAERASIDLTIIGPELPLDRGVVDRFRAAGRRVFGPPRAAAQLECSKAFAKGFMARHGIPTARYRVCDSAAAARAAIDSGEFGLPVVLKADGSFMYTAASGYKGNDSFAIYGVGEGPYGSGRSVVTVNATIQ